MDNVTNMPLNKKKPIPVYTYIVLLTNGKTLEQKATTWLESSDEDDGSGISYHFYMDKVRVLCLEYSLVKAVLCSEMCDVKAVLAAMRAPKKRKVSK